MIAAIAAIELPAQTWPELTTLLLGNITRYDSAPYLKRSTLETIGFICEDLDESILASRSNEILTAVIQGARKEETDAKVRKAAIEALNNSLDFIKPHFDSEVERNVIMQVVCEATLSPDTIVAVAAFECLVGIMTLYYDYMVPYMNQGLFQMTIDCMNHKQEAIALQAIEFWSTVCDTEIDRQIDLVEDNSADLPFYKFARGAVSYVIPTLLTLLSKQTSEDDEDEWNVSKAAATCLGLFANCVQDDLLTGTSVIFPFIEKNIGSPDWRYRDAAVMAFASILDGPSPAILEPYVKQALPMLISMITDTSTAVRDTATWSVGRIFEILDDVVDAAALPNIIQVFLGALKDEPRIASHAACGLRNIFLKYGNRLTESGEPVMSQSLFQACLTELLVCSQRPDFDESNLVSASFQAVSALVELSPNEYSNIVEQLCETIIVQLETTVASLSQPSTDVSKLLTMQAHYYTVIQAIIRRLGSQINKYADRLMATFHIILSSNDAMKSSTISEEIFLAVISLCGELESKFNRFMPSFFPKLNEAVKNHSEYALCSIAIGLVGDLARALGQNMLPYADEIVMSLFEAVQDPYLDRSVKPHVISTFGDMASALGSQYKRYLSGTMVILEQAATSNIPRDTVDNVEYLNDLRSSILETYSSIVQSFKTENIESDLLSFLPGLNQFVMIISQDSDTSETVARNGIGLIGDLVAAFNEHYKRYEGEKMWIVPFVRKYRNANSFSEMTVSVSNWTYRLIKPIFGL